MYVWLHKHAHIGNRYHYKVYLVAHYEHCWLSKLAMFVIIFLFFRFEEVRARYERRESRQEDLNLIADLKQVIAEQEKDLACINEEKRFFQMRLMNLERRLEEDDDHFVDTEDFEEVTQDRREKSCDLPNGFTQMCSSIPLGNISIPPTIPECDES